MLISFILIWIVLSLIFSQTMVSKSHFKSKNFEELKFVIAPNHVLKNELKRVSYHLVSVISGIYGFTYSFINYCFYLFLSPIYVFLGLSRLKKKDK